MEKPDTWLFIVVTISLVISIIPDTGNLFNRMSDSEETPTQSLIGLFLTLTKKAMLS